MSVDFFYFFKTLWRKPCLANFYPFPGETEFSIGINFNLSVLKIVIVKLVERFHRNSVFLISSDYLRIPHQFSPKFTNLHCHRNSKEVLLSLN